MPKAIPDGLTADHVHQALAELESGVEHPFGPPTGYELIYDGKRYPPKAVVGIAFRHLTGSILPPDAFSGGESQGQANYVLRNLEFTVEPIQGQCREFVTSRGYALPTSGDDLAGWMWFNMWKPRLFPYRELDVGNTLFWYDSTAQAIVWKTKVNDIDRFEYKSKDEVRTRLIERFGSDPIDDPYYIDASDHGYCLAYKVTPVEQLNVAKPPDYRFPQIGWLRCDDAEAQSWLSQLLAVDPDGRLSPQLRQSALKANDEGYFDPQNLEDERERQLQEIIRRRGQPEFRAKLIDAYGGRCAVTGWDAVSALEAAHITPYLGPSSHHVSNGLLLRADIHTLFDLDLIGIDPASLIVILAAQLRQTCYQEFAGKAISLPDDPAIRPSEEALKKRWKAFCSET